MTIEEELKDYIIKKYGTLRKFTEKIDIPNSTFSNILRRGLMNANVLTIIKICDELSISPDALAEGKIVPIIKDNPKKLLTIDDIIDDTKQRIINADQLYFNGTKATKDDISFILSVLDTIPMMRSNQMKRIQAYDRRLREIKNDKLS